MLFITGNDSEDLVYEAAQAGAYDFIKKPVNRDMLVLAVKRALEAHQWRRERQKDTILCAEGLPTSLSVQDFRDSLAPFGTILWVRLVLDRFANGEAAAYGYVEFTTTAEAEQARSCIASTSLGQHIHFSLCSDVIQHRSS
jgi:hypothetical protein